MSTPLDGYLSANEKNDEDQLVNQISLSEKAQSLITRLISQLSIRVDRIDQAKKIIIIIKKLRKLCDIDENIIKQCYHKNLLDYLLSSSEFTSRYELLLENIYHIITLICRQIDIRKNAISELVENGAIILYMSSIRTYMHNVNIRVMAVELLGRSLEYITQLPEQNQKDNTLSTLQDYLAPKSRSKKYFFHHLMMHGALSSFSSLLTIFTQSSNEMSLRRILKCKYNIYYNYDSL